MLSGSAIAETPGEGLLTDCRRALNGSTPGMVGLRIAARQRDKDPHEGCARRPSRLRLPSGPHAEGPVGGLNWCHAFDMHGTHRLQVHR
jgi:hypothetical protein